MSAPGATSVAGTAIGATGAGTNATAGAARIASAFAAAREGGRAALTSRRSLIGSKDAAVTLNAGCAGVGDISCRFLFRRLHFF